MKNRLIFYINQTAVDIRGSEMKTIVIHIGFFFSEISIAYLFSNEQ